MAQESLEQKQKRTVKIIAELKKTHPDAKLALDFTNPLELLVALILAAQARDERVNEVTAAVFKKYTTPDDWAHQATEELQAQLSKISFFRNKTKSIQGACRMLIEKFGGRVPDKLEDLLELPGVGRKTANILLGNAFGKAALGVDRHVMRVSQRLGLTTEEDPDKIEFDLVKIVPPAEQVKFCHLLQYHGRRICVARKPLCFQCPIEKLCLYPKKTKA